MEKGAYPTDAQRLLARFAADAARHIHGAAPLHGREWASARSYSYRDRVKVVLYTRDASGGRVRWVYHHGGRTMTWLWAWRCERAGEPGYALCPMRVPVWVPSSEVEELDD